MPLYDSVIENTHKYDNWYVKIPSERAYKMLHRLVSGL